MCIEPFECSATQILNGSCILSIVVGDSPTKSSWQPIVRTLFKPSRRWPYHSRNQGDEGGIPNSGVYT